MLFSNAFYLICLIFCLLWLSPVNSQDCVPFGGPCQQFGDCCVSKFQIKKSKNGFRVISVIMLIRMFKDSAPEAATVRQRKGHNDTARELWLVIEIYLLSLKLFSLLNFYACPEIVKK